MKNIKRLLFAAAALVATGSMATIFQPNIPISEDAPLRISTGLSHGFFKPDTGFGPLKHSLGLGILYTPGYDFNIGGSVAGGVAAGGNRLYTDAAKEEYGFRIDVELMASFLPEVAEGFHVGVLLGLGFDRQFGGKSTKAMAENIAFGDLSGKVGLGLSYFVTEIVNINLFPSYTLSGVRFASDKATDADAIKANSFLSGLEVPVGFGFTVADNMILYVEANTKFTNFSDFANSWQEDVSFGLSIDI
jgi:hypothetical protein